VSESERERGHPGEWKGESRSRRAQGVDELLASFAERRAAGCERSRAGSSVPVNDFRPRSRRWQGA
jgi:hypothetical protein